LTAANTSRPLLLQLAMAAGAVFGTVGTLVGAWAFVGLLAQDGPLLVDDVSLSKAEFLSVALPLLAVYVMACLTAGAAALALWNDRARSRVLLTALLLEFVIGDSVMLAVMHRTLGASLMSLAAPAASFVLLVALALWYLFRKSSVVQYYAALG